MKKVVIALIAIVAVIAGVFCANSMKVVDQGELGVVWTTKNGVQDETLSPGWHFVGPFAKVKCYPTAQQQIVFSNNPEDYNEKEHADWSIDATCDGGMVKINLTVNYNFDPDRITEIYKKFNGMDGEKIVESRVQNSIIAYTKEVTPNYTVMEIYSTKRSEVSQAITEYLNEKLSKEYGINVSSALIIDVQLDDTLTEKIQAKEQAKQDAEKAELDKQTVIAQGEANKAAAESQAEVQKVQAEAAAEQKKIQAEADAEATKIAAEAEAEANKQVAESLTPELIEKIKYERWDGKLPTVSGSGSTIVNVGDVTEESAAETTAVAEGE